MDPKPSIRRRRSSGSAWIEPKHGTPCRVCWRRNGERQTPSEWFSKRSEAIALRDAINERLRLERPLTVAGQTLALTEVMERWLRARRDSGLMAEGTVYKTRAAIAAILRQTEWETVHDITAAALAEWRAANPSAGMGRPMRSLKAMLRWCANPKTLHQAVADDLDLSVPQTRMAERAMPSPQQLAIMLERAKSHGQHALVHCLFTYPWRPKSFILLERSDLDLRNPLRPMMLLRNTKNGKDVPGRLLPETAAILREYLGQRTGRVFLNPWGEPWAIAKGGSSDSLSKWFRKYIAHDMPHVAYDGKRGSLTDLMEATNNDIATVAKVAGISKVTVLRYVQSNDDKERAAIAKLGALRRGQFGGNSESNGDNIRESERAGGDPGSVVTAG